MDFDKLTRRLRLRHRQALSAKVFDMQFNGFVDQVQGLVPRRAHGAAAGQVWHVRTVACFTCFDNNEVSQNERTGVHLSLGVITQNKLSRT